jgi:hypothetical protein
VTRLGIDPGTVRLVAQRLNHYATQGPQLTDYLIKSALLENTHFLNMGQQNFNKEKILFLIQCRQTFICFVTI